MNVELNRPEVEEEAEAMNRWRWATTTTAAAMACPARQGGEPINGRRERERKVSSFFAHFVQFCGPLEGAIGGAFCSRLGNLRRCDDHGAVILIFLSDLTSKKVSNQRPFCRLPEKKISFLSLFVLAFLRSGLCEPEGESGFLAGLWQ